MEDKSIPKARARDSRPVSVKSSVNKSVADKSVKKNIAEKSNRNYGGNGKNNNNGRDGRRSRQAIPNEHYLAIAFRLKAARLLLLVMLFLFVVSNAVINSKELTVDNINYLLRYIDIQGSSKTEALEFSIDIDEESQIGYYKNNIVVLKKNKLDIYDLNGRRNFSHQLAYSMPVLNISGKYIVAYDSGINKLQIFNSFSRLYEYKNEYDEARPIYSAKVTEKGNIVYITSKKGYKFAVKVMNKDFGEIYECAFGDKYITDADIDDGAKRLAVAGFKAEDGDFQGELLLYDTNSEDCRERFVLPGEMPLSVKFNNSGFFALCENSFRAYGKDYESLTDYNFGYRAIEAFQFTQELAAVILNEKKLRNENSILIFNADGELIFSETVNIDILDIKFSKKCDVLYFLTRGGLYRIDIEKKLYELVTENYDDTSRKIVYADDKNIFISGLTKVDILKVENEDE